MRKSITSCLTYFNGRSHPGTGSGKPFKWMMRLRTLDLDLSTYPAIQLTSHNSGGFVSIFVFHVKVKFRPAAAPQNRRAFDKEC